MPSYIMYPSIIGKRAEAIAEIEKTSAQQRDSGVFLNWDEADLYVEDQLDLDIYDNRIPNDPVHRVTSNRKTDITNFIYSCGIEYHVQMDNDFTLSG